uniref:hypothetical protein n=1 Tax=Nonomuraea dietziae TaxID=65515 RepID=UPI001FEA541F|nr:hypothetical protein [Nonomuraea dietziae]
MISTWGGSRLPAVKTTSSTLRPGMRSLAMAKAVKEAISSVRITPGTTMISVLR